MKNGAAMAAAFFVGMGILMYKHANSPRGIKNNNPLNIRDNSSNNWRGKIGVDDKKFVVFESVEYGYRAASKILDSYARRGIVTLADIISNWSPPQGIDASGVSYINPTESYIIGVSQKTGIAPNETVNKNDYPTLLMAMTYHENGVFPYNIETIKDGVMLANV